MGIKNLRKFLKKSAPSGVKNISLFQGYPGKKVCIDVNSYLYKMCYNSDTKGKNYYLKGFTQIIFDFLSNNIIPVFIFDGIPPEAKLSGACIQRKQAKDKKYETITDNVSNICELLDISECSSMAELDKEIEKALSEDRLSEEELKVLFKCTSEIVKNKKNIITVTDDMHKKLEILFNLCGIPHLTAKGEADFLCARLISDKVVSAVISEDMDIIAHGADKLLTGFMSTSFMRKKEVEEFDLQKILQELHLTQSQFIDFCILSGCDYCETIPDIGPMKGYQLILQYESMDNFPKEIVVPEKLFAARKEFYKYRDEDYDVEEIRFKGIKEIELISFLVENTSFRSVTIAKKIKSVNLH